MKSFEVLAKASDQGRAKEVNEVSASLEVIDDTFTAYNFQGV